MIRFPEISSLVAPGARKCAPEGAGDYSRKYREERQRISFFGWFAEKIRSEGNKDGHAQPDSQYSFIKLHQKKYADRNTDSGAYDKWPQERFANIPAYRYERNSDNKEREYANEPGGLIDSHEVRVDAHRDKTKAESGESDGKRCEGGNDRDEDDISYGHAQPFPIQYEISADKEYL